MSLFTFPSGQARVRLVQVSAALTIAALVQGCGAGYRPVVTPVNPSGPSAQPAGRVITISNPLPTSSTTPNGIATVINYSGDTIMATAEVGPDPIAFTLDQSGSSGYTLNNDGTLTYFPAINSLQQKSVQYSTLPAAQQIVNLFSPSAGFWTADLNNNVSDVLTGSPPSFKLAIPVALNPVTIVGSGTIGQRNYAISQGATSSAMQCSLAPTSGPFGTATAMETTSYTVSASIPLGRCPVFAVQSPDAQRLFVLNRGSDTITVINSVNNTLDACTPFVAQNGRTVTCHPSLPLSTTAGLTGTNVPAVAGPVYAEYNAATSQLIVADYDGGTISVIDVSLDIYGNDSDTFGTTYTIPVGSHPASVTALYNGSRAYTANQSDGTVTIVNLSSHSVEKTLTVVGHPRTVVSIANSLYGKVYAASPDSPYLTVISTDQDVIDTTILVQGNIIDVRTSSQNGISGNALNNSRVPGYGQPCYLPANVLADNGITTPTLAQCQSQVLP